MSGKNVWRPGESFKTGSVDKKQRQEAYIEWLLTPEAEREPQTKGGLADLLGVTTQTLRNYAQDPYVQAELAKRSRSLARVERVPEILAALHAQASNPEHPRSVQAARVMLDWIDKAIDFGGDKPVEELTDEELFSLFRLMKEKLELG